MHKIQCIGGVYIYIYIFRAPIMSHLTFLAVSNFVMWSFFSRTVLIKSLFSSSRLNYRFRIAVLNLAVNVFVRGWQGLKNGPPPFQQEPTLVAQLDRLEFIFLIPLMFQTPAHCCVCFSSLAHRRTLEKKRWGEKQQKEIKRVRWERGKNKLRETDTGISISNMQVKYIVNGEGSSSTRKKKQESAKRNTLSFILINTVFLSTSH